MNNIIAYWPNLSRAYEIAKLGNLSIKIVFDPEYKAGFDDYQSIKKFYNDVKFLPDGDLIIEIYKPDYIIKHKPESKDDIIQRVIRANKNQLPGIELNPASILLFKTAIDKLDFSLIDQEQIIKIAQLIAQLDGSNEIRTEHLAEAIQYKCPYGPLINACNQFAEFGPGIKIATNKLNETDIEAAIKYLQSK